TSSSSRCRRGRRARRSCATLRASWSPTSRACRFRPTRSSAAAPGAACTGPTSDRRRAVMTDTAASLREALDDLLASLDAARARQWETSPVPRPRDDTTERSKGEAPSDPTADTVLDARRLAVRKEVQLAEG